GWLARRAGGETAAESTPPDASPAAAPRGVTAPEAAATVSPACSRLAFAAAPREEREPPVAWARSPSKGVPPLDVAGAGWRGREPRGRGGGGPWGAAPPQGVGRAGGRGREPPRWAAGAPWGAASPHDETEASRGRRLPFPA